MMTRRQFAIGSIATVGSKIAACEPAPDDLVDKLGLVTASLSPHFARTPTPGKITLLQLPRFMKDELGLKIIDFNSANFPSFAPNYLAKLRRKIEKSGCIPTNLKMNQRVDMNSPDPEIWSDAMRVYRNTIDAAAILGCRWVRPLPGPEKPDMKRHISAYRQLADYAGEKGITVLVENFGWMMDEADSVVNLVDAIGKDVVEIGLDTGNWTSNEVRYSALEQSFPKAVTCDFKAKALTEDFEHSAYDLEKCFQIGRTAGYRGPWCFEHANRDFETAKRELVWLRDQLTQWIAASLK